MVIFTTVCCVLGCKRAPTEPAAAQATEQQVLTDFATVVVNPNYQDLQEKSNALYAAVLKLDSVSSDANLATAQTAWREARDPWETAEGYLFGPIEDFNYDPSVDTWPLSKTELDSLLASNNPLTVPDIDALPYSLKGFHALEYVLFTTEDPANLTTREKKYAVSLAESMVNTFTALKDSWEPTMGNFTGQLVHAGTGGDTLRYPRRKDALLAIVGGMSDICSEVADEKMEDPLIHRDSTLSESSVSHNSTRDFRNNITGVSHAYFCHYQSSGHSLSEFVSSKNIALDNKIKSLINSAINSFDNISSDYEQAIFTQQVQIHNTQAAIRSLQDAIDNDLTNFIQANVSD